MLRQHMLCTAVLAGVGLLASGEAQAQAHGPPARQWKTPAPDLNDPAQRAEMMAKVGTWLRRLVGTYRYDGIVQFGLGDERQVRGERDCVAVGDGPGVQCVFEMTWPEIGPLGANGPRSNFKPAVVLYGIGPTAAEVNFMQVDNRGIPEGIPAKLRERDTVRFQVPCTNEPPLCRRIVRITARPGVPIEMKIDTWGNYFGDMTPAVTYLLRLTPTAPAAE